MQRIAQWLESDPQPSVADLGAVLLGHDTRAILELILELGPRARTQALAEIEHLIANEPFAEIRSRMPELADALSVRTTRIIARRLAETIDREGQLRTPDTPVGRLMQEHLNRLSLRSLLELMGRRMIAIVRQK